MSVSILPFKVEHLALLDIREEQKKEFEVFIKAPRKDLEVFFKNMTYRYSAFIDGKLVFILFGGMLNENTIELCGLVSKDLSKLYSHKAHREFKNLMEAIFRGRQKRYQITVVEGFEVAEKFAKSMGFKYETRLKKFHGDKDNLVYSYIKE